MSNQKYMSGIIRHQANMYDIPSGISSGISSGEYIMNEYLKAYKQGCLAHQRGMHQSYVLGIIAPAYKAYLDSRSPLVNRDYIFNNTYAAAVLLFERDRP